MRKVYQKCIFLAFSAVSDSRTQAQLDPGIVNLDATKASRQLVHKIRAYNDIMWSDDSNASLKSSATFNQGAALLRAAL
jgi:hypothetical protein